MSTTVKTTLEDRIKLTVEHVAKNIKLLLKRDNIKHTEPIVNIDTSANRVCFEIENNSTIFVRDSLVDCVQESEYGICIDVGHREGHYDWDSDTFIRPSSYIVFSC
jgi:hypothetical protein